MDWWYSQQIRQYRLQFVRAFSNFYVQFGAGTASQQLRQVPCRYGEMSRIAASIVNGNSENKAPTVPFIACFITGMSMAPDRRQAPYLTETILVNERAYNAGQQAYTSEIGNRYSIDRYMPVPYNLNFEVTLWTSNIDTKEQLLEQILTLYNPAIDIQTSDNPIDWSMITTIEMTDSMTWTSIPVPAGTDTSIDITSLNFKVPIWLSPPAKVKRQSIIQEIVTRISTGTSDSNSLDWTDTEFLERIVTTPGDYSIDITQTTGNQYALSLTNNGDPVDTQKLPTVVTTSPSNIWIPGNVININGANITITGTDSTSFISVARAALVGKSISCEPYNQNQVRFYNYSGGDLVFSDVVGTPTSRLGLTPGTYPGSKLAWWRLIEALGVIRPFNSYGSNASEIRLLSDQINLTWMSSDIRGWIQQDPVDQNIMQWYIDPTSLPSADLGSVSATVNAQTTGPGVGLSNPSVGQKYLLTQPPAANSQAWGNVTASAGDIVEFDGYEWNVVFSSSSATGTHYVTNNFNGKLLMWHNGVWTNYIPSTASQGVWQISL